MKKNTRKTFYLMTFFAVAAMIAMGFLVMPNFNNSGTVSAQKADDNGGIVATADMIALSTNIKSAGNFAIFAERGISDVGGSQIKGDVGVAGKDAQVSLDRSIVQGNSYVDPSDALRAQNDLTASFNALTQLPCTEVKDSELGGKRFTPGVYCVSSARLAGQAVMDAENNPSGVFIFRIAGSFNTKAGSSIELANQAAPGNVYFVAKDAINIGGGSTIKGSIFAENDIKVDDGATINGRVLSLKGGVSLSNDSVQLVDGFVEICKEIATNANNTLGADNLRNRVFRFTIPGVNGGNPIEVIEGQCAGPFLVPGAGNITITESNDSRALNSTTFVQGNFQLVGVRQRNTQTGAASAVTGVNFPLRQAFVTVPMGTINQQVSIEFTNQFAIVGFIEICKNALDTDVGLAGGFFQFIVSNTPQAPFTNPPILSGSFQIFSVPSGACVGPLAVTVPSNGTGSPRSGIASVAEISRVGFQFVGATTTPPERLIRVQILNQTPSPTLLRLAGIVDGVVFEAGASNNQTRFNFFNRSRPAPVKICKVAGPGIPEGTRFNFTVSGTAQTFDPANTTDSENGTFGTMAVSRTFDVAAGLSSNNGGCRFVPTSDNGASTTQQLFVVGSTLTVTENGPTTIGVNPVRVGRITSTSGFIRIGSATCALTTTGASAAGNVFFPTNGLCRTVEVPVRSNIIEVEFTNFVFRPGSLKICKIAGTGVTIGTAFTFNVTVDTNQGVFPGAVNTRTIPVTVQAGPASQGGFCTVVNGPFSDTTFGNTTGTTGLPINAGTFNVGSVVTVTENIVNGVNVTGIRTTSGGPFTGNLGAGSGTVTILGPTGGTPGTTEVEFTNTAVTIAPPVEPRASTAFDFDGDKKADISVFRDGNWYLNRSDLGFTALQFGKAGDKLVPADYDGDGKADIAVYRAEPDPTKGYFYMLSSKTGAFSFTQFGINTDVPVVGDYDGDGYADIAVYRDGKNAGDASYIYYRPSSRPGVDFVTIQLGAKGDIPVVGDYDGDKVTDAAVFRPSNGTWYILRSTAGFTGVQFGIATDIPVAADYDGDGKTDIAVYRSGTWYLLQSSKGFTGLQFGAATDMPVPADIDGDGKDDIAVFRAGTWYWLNSKDGSFQGAQFGLATDVPVFCPASHQ